MKGRVADIFRRAATMALLVIVATQVALSQPAARALTGSVTDGKTGEAVSYVTVKALSAADSLLSYAMTSADGAFKLTLPSGAETVEFTLMGYETKRVPVRDTRQGMRVSLAPSGITLRELTVKARPMERSRDTINYNVAAFKGKEDRYIEDVLKKMPGITVSDNGSISYQGKPINKFNIEGQDLLGNQYNQATRNLPADAVATVQVMENDQPVRALKDRVPSDKATLNIKLKRDYKSRPFGEAVGGIGGTEDALWNNRLTLINVGRKTQALLTARMNNNGESLASDTEEHVDYSDIYNYEPLPPQMVSVGGASTPPISERRYLDNKSYTAGLNLIHRAGRYGSLRANVTYFGTTDTSSDSTYHFYGGQETLSLGEADRLKATKHTLMPRVRYELNAPRVYLVDEFGGSLTFDRQLNAKRVTRFAGAAATSASSDGSSSAGQEQADQLAERGARHPGYLQNKLQMTFNSGNTSYSVNSLLRYFRRSETLDVTEDDDQPEDTPPYSLAQRIAFSRLMTRNSIGTRFYVGRNSLELSYAFELRSDQVALDGGESHGTLYMKHTISPEYVARYSRGHVTIDLPVSVFTSRVGWSGVSAKTKTYLSPTVSWRHDFSQLWRVTLTGGLERDASDDIMLPEEYFSGYRTRLQTVDRIGWRRSERASFTLNYGNVVSMLVWNFMAMATWNTDDHYSEYTYGERFTTVRPVWRDVRSRMLFVMTSLDKTFTRAGLSLKSTLNYNRTSTPVAQNGLTLDVTAHVMAAAATLRWSKLKWLAVTLRPTFNLTWQDPYAGNDGHNTLKSFYDEVEAHLFPVRGLDMSLRWEYNLLEVERGRYRRNSFLDASARYALTKRMEFSLAMTNLLNRREYCEASFDGLDYGYMSMPLRGRELLFSVTFSF